MDELPPTWSLLEVEDGGEGSFFGGNVGDFGDERGVISGDVGAFRDVLCRLFGRDLGGSSGALFGPGLGVVDGAVDDEDVFILPSIRLWMNSRSTSAGFMRMQLRS